MLTTWLRSQQVLIWGASGVHGPSRRVHRMLKRTATAFQLVAPALKEEKSTHSDEEDEHVREAGTEKTADVFARKTSEQVRRFLFGDLQHDKDHCVTFHDVTLQYIPYLLYLPTYNVLGVLRLAAVSAGGVDRQASAVRPSKLLRTAGASVYIYHAHIVAITNCFHK